MNIEQMEDIKEGDCLQYATTNWFVKQIIDFKCEGCELRHRAFVVAFRNSQFQTWPFSGMDYFWGSVTLRVKS